MRGAHEKLNCQSECRKKGSVLKNGDKALLISPYPHHMPSKYSIQSTYASIIFCLLHCSRNWKLFFAFGFHWYICCHLVSIGTSARIQLLSQPNSEYTRNRESTKEWKRKCVWVSLCFCLGFALRIGDVNVECATVAYVYRVCVCKSFEIYLFRQNTRMWMLFNKRN